MNVSLDLVQLAPRENWIELYNRSMMNVSLVHTAPQESLWIELYDKNTSVSFKSTSRIISAQRIAQVCTDIDYVNFLN